MPVSVGVNVAVIVAEPAPAIVTAPVDALTLAADAFDDEYEIDPATEAASKVTVGAAGVNDESPYVFDCADIDDTVGVAFDTVTEYVTEVAAL